MTKALAERRWYKVNLIAWLLQATPFIRFIGVTGSMAYDVVKPSSDIDIFIIAQGKRIWTCRAFSRALLYIVGQLRVGDLPKQRAGKVCPNRYVNDKYLVINPQNRYHAQDYTQMVPLFDIGGLYQKFIIANSWMEEFGFFKPRKVLNLVDSRTLTWLRKALEWILQGVLGDWLEKKLKANQLKRIFQEEPNTNQEDSPIVVNDNEIRIHPKPRS